MIRLGLGAVGAKMAGSGYLRYSELETHTHTAHTAHTQHKHTHTHTHTRIPSPTREPEAVGANSPTYSLSASLSLTLCVSLSPSDSGVPAARPACHASRVFTLPRSRILGVAGGGTCSLQLNFWASRAHSGSGCNLDLKNWRLRLMQASC